MRTIVQTDEITCVGEGGGGWDLTGYGMQPIQEGSKTLSHFMLHILELKAGLEAP